MKPLMTRLINNSVDHPVALNTEDIWNQAISEARMSRGVRRGEKPLDKMQSLKDKLASELVSFHHLLICAPHEGDCQPTMKDSRLLDISIPVTLFPKRDQGFSRIECVVEFDDGQNGQGIRVLTGEPEERSETLASAELGGELNVKGSIEQGVKIPQLDNLATADVAAKVYADVKIDGLNYQAERMCVETAVIGGTAFRWRLDDVKDKAQIRAESRQFKVVLEVSNEIQSISAAGYLNAYSDTKWLTANLGSIWRDFKGALANFFRSGLPVEAFAEWENIEAN